MITRTESIETILINEQEQISILLNGQRSYFAQGNTRDLKHRKRQLKSLKRSIKKHESQISDALYKDFRKSEFEVYISETGLCYEEINIFLKYLTAWSDPEKVHTPLSNFKGTSHIYQVPRGNVLIIGPWNYPFYLTMVPLIGAVATGNTVILKPSEYTPHTNAVIKSILVEVYNNENHVAIVEGGAETSMNLLANKFDYIFFTGSTHVGKIVAAEASKQLTPYTLELGGKSPCIVDETANLTIAAKRIMWGKVINGGQTCIAPDYLLVHQKVKDKLIREMLKVLNDFYADNPKESPDFPRIIHKKSFDRIVALMTEGDIIYGGDIDRDSLYISPTLIDNVKWGDKIMQEEIFGPVLAILTYDAIDKVIKEINDRPEPLALYFFSKNKQLQDRIIKEIKFGGGCINDTLFHIGNSYLPFGGVGQSGIGAYHGKASFDTFTHQKSIIKKATWIDVFIRYPPYKRNLRWLKKILN